MTNVSAALLLDSNILIYAVDPREDAKRGIAEDLIVAAVEAGRAVLSVQCLTEYFRVVTERLPVPLSRSEAMGRVRELTDTCEVYDLDARAVLEACRFASERQTSIWDALIWAVAKLNGVPVVLTEDCEHGSQAEGVRYLNPFAADFDAREAGLDLR